MKAWGGNVVVSLESLREDLLRAEAFRAVAQTTSVVPIETHISLVFLLDRDVFKIKKPVDLGFLDFRSLERRRGACDDEVRLNSRLAPGVYRGVVPLVRSLDGRVVVGGEGEAVEWAVHMVRLPDAERADELLRAGALTTEVIDAIAARMAAFHGAAPTDSAIREFGRPVAVARNVEENFAQTRQDLARYLSDEEAEEIVRWQSRFVRDESARFDRRIAQGRVRDGHGDLRLDHVYCHAVGDPAAAGQEGGIRVLDCIEFNERFRYADVCADVAFFSMDLAAHGRSDLAETFLASYAREADDYDLYEVVDFYESYRAFVRGKVACMLANDAGAPPAARERAVKEARRLFRLALSFGRPRVVPPSIVAVGGVIASGKSSVAAALGGAMSAPVLEADRTRKAMLGVGAFERMAEPAWQGTYAPEFSAKVYAELFRRAALVVASGRPVVLDASFRSAAHRAAARSVALAHGVPFRFVECKAPREVCLERLAVREKHASVSDGRRAIFDEFCARYEPVVELAPAESLAIDTTLPLAANLESLRRSLDVWPSGLTG